MINKSGSRSAVVAEQSKPNLNKTNSTAPKLLPDHSPQQVQIGPWLQPPIWVRASRSHRVRSQSTGSKGKDTCNREDGQIKKSGSIVKLQSGAVDLVLGPIAVLKFPSDL